MKPKKSICLLEYGAIFALLVMMVALSLVLDAGRKVKETLKDCFRERGDT